MMSIAPTPPYLKSLLTICCGTVISMSASAALTISNPQSSGTARISMGGADSLSQARTIMYTNMRQDSQQQPCSQSISIRVAM